MEWEKLGVLWTATGEPAWSQSHATLPVVQQLPNDQWWVYVSTRDGEGKSRIGRLAVDAASVPRFRHFEPTPVLSLGEPGTFDDSGVMPSWLVQDGDQLRLYYIGWNVIGTVPYRLSVGLAMSDDGGATFRRYSQGPVLDRSAREPFFATAPCVHKEGILWRMWYVSCTEWQRISERWEPCYHVKYAESRDGISWDITGVSCIDAGEGFAVGRPCVFRTGDKYGMFYSVRSMAQYRTDPAQAYRLGYAESLDGIRWSRLDHRVGIECAIDGWDSEMMEYCWLQRHGRETYLLYNGNGFGRSGVGIARLVKDA